MTLPVARMGDACTHGAFVLTGSSIRVVDGMPVAKLGDLVSCPLHGVNPITQVSVMPSTESRPDAHIGAVSACGATIIGGSFTTSEGI